MDAGPDLAAHLRHLEGELLLPEVRRSRAELEARLAPEFIEFAATGRIYDREAIVASLAVEDPAVVVIEHVAVHVLAPDVALVTYRSRRTGSASEPNPPAVNRSSIWRREGGTWRLVFHQGTPET